MLTLMLSLVPHDCSLETDVEVDFRVSADQFCHQRRVQTASRLTVWLCRFPFECAVKSCYSGDVLSRAGSISTESIIIWTTCVKLT